MKGILFDTKYDDLMIANGHLVIGDNAGQIVEQVLTANRGEYKEQPLIGAEVLTVLGANYNPFWPAMAKDMIVSAGVPVNRVVLTDNEIVVE